MAYFLSSEAIQFFLQKSSISFHVLFMIIFHGSPCLSDLSNLHFSNFLDIKRCCLWSYSSVSFLWFNVKPVSTVLPVTLLYALIGKCSSMSTFSVLKTGNTHPIISTTYHYCIFRPPPLLLQKHSFISSYFDHYGKQERKIPCMHLFTYKSVQAGSFVCSLLGFFQS